MTDLRAAVEAAFIEATNARSSVSDTLAVPYYRDVENIWKAIDTALSAHRCVRQHERCCALPEDHTEDCWCESGTDDD